MIRHVVRPSVFILLVCDLLVSQPAGAYTVLHHHVTDDGGVPNAALVADPSGTLYGTTWQGGNYDAGTVFRMRPDGTDYTILRHFVGPPYDGKNPRASVTLDGNGNLYGTTRYGGQSGSDLGTVFKLKTDGSGYMVLHSFADGSADGSQPRAGLVLDGSGFLYGTTYYGGASDFGTVFRVKTDGTGFALLHTFTGGSADARHPYAALALDGAGNLFGTTYAGGASGTGTVFRMKTDGTGFVRLHSFAPSEGQPSAGVVLDGTGNLYGTTSGLGIIYKMKVDGTSFTFVRPFGGIESEAVLCLDDTGNLFGTDSIEVFRLKTDLTSYTILHTFDATDGPRAGVILDAAGNLYGTTGRGGVATWGTAFKVKTDGTGFTLLHSFTGESPDGERPHAGLALDDAGNLYGATDGGGSVELCCPGTIFRMASNGTNYVVLRTGVGSPGSLVVEGSGNLYGVTQSNGAFYSGTVFRLTNDGSGYTVLHTFAGGAADGRYPNAGPTLDTSGNLYGTTSQGGASDYGTVYKLRTDGTAFAVLHSFAGGTSDGRFSTSGLTLDTAGYLYGTTTSGGPWDRGTVFKLKSDGTGYVVLHAFTGGTYDGEGPQGEITLDGAGNLYGTTGSGGPWNGGTVFRMKNDGTGFTVLHGFHGGSADGRVPGGRLSIDGSGNLYGMTFYGGVSDLGTVFTLKTDGSGFTLLHSFPDGPTDGYGGFGGLVIDRSGTLYGTTYYGGAWGAGVEFSLPGLITSTPTAFYTIPPCRLVDTRWAVGSRGGPALAPSATRLFALAGYCGVPSTARSLSVNVTAVAGSAAGYVTLFPGDGAPPTTSTLNFKAGQTRANNSIIRLSPDGSGSINVLNAAPAQTHFVLDVNGYFQ